MRRRSSASAELVMFCFGILAGLSWPAARAAEEVGVNVPEILVQGARVLNMDIRRSRDDAQPYVVFDRATIETSGAKDVEDFLRSRLTMDTQTFSNDQTNRTAGNSSGINLRGLGANQTLILIDGHRRAGTVAVNSTTPFGQPDLNGIPLAAIERIEILPTTASGIYGGGATGGVVNVILRRDYHGAEVGLTYDNTFESGALERRVDTSTGFQLEGGRSSVLFTGSYSDSHDLREQDRGFYDRGIRTILANNPAAILSAATPPLGATANIRSVSGANLVLKNGTSLGSPITYIPAGYAGAASDRGAALVANAGRYNLDRPDTAQITGGSQMGLLGAPEVASVALTLRREFTARMQAFLDLGASRNTDHFSSNNLLGSYVIPATAPNNPFTQAIRVRTPVYGLDTDTVTQNEAGHAVGGIIIALPRAWRVEADYTWDRSLSSAREPSAASTGAEATQIANGTLDILRDTSVFAADFSRFVPLTFWTRRSSTLKDATIRFAGPIGTLPAGAPMLSMMVEHRGEDMGSGLLYARGILQSVYGPQSQAVESAYLELNVPLVSARNAVRGIEDLELQIAGRHDRYVSNVSTVQANPGSTLSLGDNRLSSTDPTLAVRVEPVRDVTARASYGTGFLPPSLSQLAPVPSIAGAASVLSLTDPRRGNQPVTGNLIIAGVGNPNLKPERSTSWSAGLVLTPRVAPGLRVSVDWLRIDKRDNISSFSPTQALINLEGSLPGAVIRGPVAAGDPFGVGPIIGLDPRNRNISRAQVEAYDTALEYKVEGGTAGAVELFFNGTWQTHFRTQLIATDPVIENVGVGSEVFTNISPLKVRANAGLIWSYTQWRLGWTTRYFDSYLVSRTASTLLAQGGDGRVPSQIYHDMLLSYQFPTYAAASGRAASVLSALGLQLGVRNVLNSKPPFDAGNVQTYYSFYGDPRLASYYLTLKKAF